MSDSEWKTTYFEEQMDMDIPPLDLQRGDVVRVYPDAPVRHGDLVLVEVNRDLRLLTRYRTAFTGSVVGLAVKQQARGDVAGRAQG